MGQNTVLNIAQSNIRQYSDLRQNVIERPQQEYRPSEEEYLNDHEAFTAYSSGDYQKAIRLYQKLALQTNNTEKRAAFYYNWGASIHQYARTVTDRQTKVRLLIEAEAIYKKALDLNPRHIKAHNNIGVVYDSLARLSSDNTYKIKEREHYRSALGLSNTYSTAHFNSAILDYEDGNYAAMRQHVESALADPSLGRESQAKCFYFLGVYEFRSGDYPTSVEYFSRALGLGLDHNYRELRYYLSELERLLHSQKNTLVTTNSDNNTINKTSDPQILFTSGLAAYDKRAYTKALKFFDRALNNGYDQNDPSIWLMIGACYSSLGKNQQAVRAFSKAIELGYRDDNVYYCRAYSYYNIDNPNKTIRDLRQCQDRDADWHSLYGMACAELEDWKSAEKHFTEVIRQRPRSAAAYKKRAMVYWCQKRFDLAKKDLERVVALNPRDNTAQYYLYILNHTPANVLNYLAL